MTTKRALRLGKVLRWELLLLFERNQGFSVKGLYSKLPQGTVTLGTLYNYHRRWKFADRKVRELQKHL